jgi:hypothetical protein
MHVADELRAETLPARPAPRKPSATVRLFVAVQRHPYVVLGAILGLSVFLSGAFAWTKRPWCDEAWFASPAYNLLNRGSMGTTILDPHGFAYTPDLKSIDRFTFWVMPAYFVAQAAWSAVVGFGLISMRCLSIAWSAVALLSWFVIMRWITGNRNLALIAVFLLGTEQQFIRSAGFGRMDMMCFALGLASLAVYLYLREQRFTLAVMVSGCLAAVALFTHPNGVFSTLILSGFLLWLDRKRITPKIVLLSALPLVILGSLWATYTLQAPEAFLAQIHSQSSFFELQSNPFRALAAEISGRYQLPYALSAPFPVSVGSLILCAYALAIILNLAVPTLRRSRASRVLLAMATFEFVMQLCVKKSWYYLVYVLPFYTGLLTLAMHWIWLKGRSWKSSVCFALMMITAVNMGFILVRVRHDDRRPFQEVVNYLRQNASRGDLIMGSGELGFGLGFDGQVLDDARLGFLSGRTPRFVVIEPQYRSYWFPWLRVHEPAAAAHIAAILKQYHLVYDQSLNKKDKWFNDWPYQIYRRPVPVRN